MSIYKSLYDIEKGPAEKDTLLSSWAFPVIFLVCLGAVVHELCAQ